MPWGVSHGCLFGLCSEGLCRFTFHWQPVWGPICPQPRPRSVFLTWSRRACTTSHCACELPSPDGDTPCSCPGLPFGETALRASCGFACWPLCAPLSVEWVLPQCEVLPPWCVAPGPCSQAVASVLLTRSFTDQEFEGLT